MVDRTVILVARQRSFPAESVELLKKELSKNSAILSTSDSEKVDTIFKENSMLEGMERNSLKSLFENRITSLQEENRRNTEMLIKKYNPQFSEKDLQAMLSETVRTAPKISVLSGLDSDLLNEKSTTNEKINRLRKNVSDSYRINERMEKIPYINSAGRAILHIAARFKDIVATYDQIVVNLVSGLRKKNEQIKYYDYAFNYVIRDEKECGYILDPRNPENMGVFVNRVHNIKPGDMGYVFRQDDEFVGTIKFKKNNGIITAETIQLVKGVKPLPFDRIMLNKIEKNDGGLK